MRKVLIVEPNAADARVLRDTLREAGLGNASTVLRDAIAAKRHLAERDHDAIMLLNIHASDDGLEFLAWLRQQSFFNDLFIIAVGERGHLRGVVQACEGGAQTFVIKPVHVEDLKTVARMYPDQWDRPRE